MRVCAVALEVRRPAAVEIRLAGQAFLDSDVVGCGLVQDAVVGGREKGKRGEGGCAVLGSGFGCSEGC